MLTFFQRSSIKLRLTLAYAVVVCVALLTLSVAVYNSVQNSMDAEVDQQLQQSADDVRNFFSRLTVNTLTPGDLQTFSSVFGGKSETPPGAYSMPKTADSTNALRMRFTSGLTYLQIVNTDGKFAGGAPNDLLAMQSDANQKSLLALVHSGTSPYNSITLDNGTRLRVLTLPIKLREQTVGYVQAARSLEEIDTLRSQILWPFVIGGLVTALIVTLLVWVITRSVFNPIQNITSTAYQIGVSGDLTQRIKINDSSKDEVSRLGRAFNAMLSRLEDTFQMQRQFIADSSHELRTPLTVIRGNLDLLKRNPDPQNQAESLVAIERESVRMQRLVQDLLLLAQADASQAFEMLPVQLDTIVLEVFMETKVLADAKRQTLKLAHFDAVTVDGDTERLKRGLINLVENAIKYTPEEGHISVSLFKGTKWARVVVADDGIGIGEADQQHIFDRFFRVDKARSRNGGGTGLGLAIVKHIIEGHGGRITLKSAPAQGSEFTVWLRLDPAADLSALSDDTHEDFPLQSEPISNLSS